MCLKKKKPKQWESELSAVSIAIRVICHSSMDWNVKFPALELQCTRQMTYETSAVCTHKVVIYLGNVIVVIR